jgi:hypothetical protein
MASRVLADPTAGCPDEILARQVVVEPAYLGFDGQVRTGRVEVHQDAADDLAAFFAEALTLGFPFDRVAAASDLGWDDRRLMATNVTSAFNYRTVAGRATLSYHAIGAAIDVNPRLNPYSRTVDGTVVVEPPGAVWRPGTPGTLTADHPLVLLLVARGWDWGGSWSLDDGGVLDHQHFQKTALTPPGRT